MIFTCTIIVRTELLIQLGVDWNFREISYMLACLFIINRTDLGKTQLLLFSKLHQSFIGLINLEFFNLTKILFHQPYSLIQNCRMTLSSLLSVFTSELEWNVLCKMTHKGRKIENFLAMLVSTFRLCNCAWSYEMFAKIALWNELVMQQSQSLIIKLLLKWFFLFTMVFCEE